MMGKPPKQPVKNLNKLLDWHNVPGTHHYFTVKYKLDDWKIINIRESEDEQINVTQLKKYCQEHGWTSPVHGDPDAKDE
jgi:hypothetical protein